MTGRAKVKIRIMIVMPQVLRTRGTFEEKLPADMPVAGLSAPVLRSTARVQVKESAFSADNVLYDYFKSRSNSDKLGRNVG